MKITKIVSVFLVLALVFGCLFSCGANEPDPVELIKKANEKIDNSPYSIEMDMSFKTENAKYKDTLAAMSVKDVEIDVNGNNFNMDMDLTVSGIETDMVYTVYDGVLYVNMVLSAYGQTQSVKKKAALTDEQIKKFMGTNGVDSDLDIEDFEEYSLTKEENTYVITCQGVTDELNEILKDKVSSLAGEAQLTVSGVRYKVEIEDGKYDSITLSCDYTMTVESETIEFTMITEIDYDYDKDVKINAPADAAQYETVDPSEILGE